MLGGMQACRQMSNCSSMYGQVTSQEPNGFSKGNNGQRAHQIADKTRQRKRHGAYAQNQDLSLGPEVCNRRNLLMLAATVNGYIQSQRRAVAANEDARSLYNRASGARQCISRLLLPDWSLRMNISQIVSHCC